VGLWVGLPLVAQIWTCSLFLSMHTKKKKKERKPVELREGRVGTESSSFVCRLSNAVLIFVLLKLTKIRTNCHFTVILFSLKKIN